MVIMVPDPNNPGKYKAIEENLNPTSSQRFPTRFDPLPSRKIAINNERDLREYFRNNNWQKPAEGSIQQQMIYNYLNTLPDRRRDHVIGYIERKIPGYDPYKPVVFDRPDFHDRPCMTTFGPCNNTVPIGVDPKPPLLNKPIPGHDYPLWGVDPKPPLLNKPIPGRDFGVAPTPPMPGAGWGSGIGVYGNLYKQLPSYLAQHPTSSGDTNPNFNPLTTNLANPGVSPTTIGKYGGKKKGKTAHNSGKNQKKEQRFYGI